MQKDAIIEAIASIIAKISHYQESQPNDPQSAQDWRNAVEWRKKLYKNHESLIDYAEVLTFQKKMSQRYSA